MKYGFKRDLKRLGATLGVFGGIVAMVFVIGMGMNKHITILQFVLALMTISVIMIGCIQYISKHTEGGEWIED